ncbi:hypothetical protein G7046_g2013 [Stylonectria norvegica]|nr:hypothetical protein G7046_g2013 [Stylonectria norvegica]
MNTVSGSRDTVLMSSSISAPLWNFTKCLIGPEAISSFLVASQLNGYAKVGHCLGLDGAKSACRSGIIGHRAERVVQPVDEVLITCTTGSANVDDGFGCPANHEVVHVLEDAAVWYYCGPETRRRASEASTRDTSSLHLHTSLGSPAVTRRPIIDNCEAFVALVTLAISTTITTTSATSLSRSRSQSPSLPPQWRAISSTRSSERELPMAMAPPLTIRRRVSSLHLLCPPLYPPLTQPLPRSLVYSSRACRAALLLAVLPLQDQERCLGVGSRVLAVTLRELQLLGVGAIGSDEAWMHSTMRCVGDGRETQRQAQAQAQAQTQSEETKTPKEDDERYA